jgi:hypothetical protein
MNTTKWSRVTLRIDGEDLQPDEVSTLLDLKPTHAHLRGERKSPRVAKAWVSSHWSLTSPLSNEEEIPKHLRWLLDLLEPRAQTLKGISKRFRVDFFCGFASENGQGGFTLDTDTLRRIAELGIPMELDLYPPELAAE